MRVVTETGRVIPQDVNCVFHIQQTAGTQADGE